MGASKQHPLHDLLVPILDQWAGLYCRWEEIRPQILQLERERHVEVMSGDRERKLPRIHRHLAELRAEIEPTQPRERYIWADGKVIGDTWFEFVSHWRFLQRKAAWPVGPTGSPVTEEENAAWRLLVKNHRL